MMDYHTPVLLAESIDGLKVKPDGIYVDVTFGGGGHSREILKKLNRGKLIALDQDEEAAANVMDDDRFLFIRGNYRFLSNYMRYYGIENINGILADLGVSSRHFDVAERGFAFRFEGPLDMRMNRSAGDTAADLLNTSPETKLYEIFSVYGEVHNTGKLVKTICMNREKSPVHSISQFLEMIKSCIPRKKENQYLAKVFQALRIAVNNELEVLKTFLQQSARLLIPGGRLVVITYHSLEDRLVKNFIKCGNFEGEQHKDLYGNIISPLHQVNRRVIVPGEEELKKNNRARSAKLRIAEKI